jgi:hypothetical protein
VGELAGIEHGLRQITGEAVGTDEQH